MSLSQRAAALLAAGSLAVHELRYAVGYGDPGATGEAGHGYLAWLAPLVALALAVACGVWLARIGRRHRTAPVLTWLRASTALAGIYVVQETAEALTAPGHPGLLAHGGWVAVPIIVGVGAIVTLVMRGVRVVDEAAVDAARPWSPAGAIVASPLAFALPAAAPRAPRARGLARRIAGRAPPLVS